MQCNGAVGLGDAVAVCGRCGSLHHAACWQAHDGCGSFDCAPARRCLGPESPPALRISDEEIHRAVPPPTRRSLVPVVVPQEPNPSPRGRSRMAVASLVTAVLGIPLFGVVTGLVAILLGSMALGGISRSRKRGTWIAVSGVLLGVLDMVGWVIFLASFYGHSMGDVHMVDFEPDLSALDHLSPRIARAVKANVLIESDGMFGLLSGKAIGSGVILQIRSDKALIVTNRHVVDSGYSSDDSQPDKAAVASDLHVKLLGQLTQPGRVVWLAPDKIDLALVEVISLGQPAEAAKWKDDWPLTIGDDVFTIGNPQHLDWSHTRGSISQIRIQHRGNRSIRVIQTDAALNPGNSGGGLYDQHGMLIGINTWTNDRRFSEGLGFAIALESLLKLDPPPLRDRTAENRAKGTADQKTHRPSKPDSGELP